MQSVLKAPLFKKLFIFFRLRQHFERLWGQSGELLGPGRRKRRRRLSPQIRKWWISFFLKVCAEGEVARQGVWPQCPVSPLLSPLLIFSSFFSLNLSQVFFPSLSFFLPLLFSFTFYHFLLVSLFHSPFFLLTVFSFFHFFPLPSFSLTFSFLLPLFLSVSLFLTSFFPFSILLHSLISSSSVLLSFSLFSSFSIFRSFSIFFPFFLFHFFFFVCLFFFFFAWVRPP